jgi:hypothetical protein
VEPIFAFIGFHHARTPVDHVHVRGNEKQKQMSFFNKEEFQLERFFQTSTKERKKGELTHHDWQVFVPRVSIGNIFSETNALLASWRQREHFDVSNQVGVLEFEDFSENFNGGCDASLFHFSNKVFPCWSVEISFYNAFKQQF